MYFFFNRFLRGYEKEVSYGWVIFLKAVFARLNIQLFRRETETITENIEKKTCGVSQRVFFFFFFFLLHFFCVGQDIQFSQFYTNVLYLNPAFAGSAHQSRAILHQRVQWPGLQAKYVTSVLSVDHYFEKARSGVGLMFLKDWQGGNRISSTEFAAMYSYELHLTPTLTFRAGFQVSSISRYLNYAVLTFPDQFSYSGYTGSATAEPFGSAKKTFLDLSTGGILYTGRFFVGSSWHHMNTPNQAFYGADTSRLPYKADLFAGYKLLLTRDRGLASDNDHEHSITPTFYYKSQGKSDQVDIGLYGRYNVLILGVWYRGIPLLKRYNRHLQNNESVVLLMGWKHKGLSIGYSFDFTVSKLTISRTLGSHELNITYLFDWPPKRRKRMRRIPCPHFYR